MHYRLAAAVTSRARSTQPEDLRAKIRPCFSPPVWPSESFRAIAVTRIEETRDEMKRGNVGHSWFLLCSPPRRVDERDERGSSAPPCLLCKVCCRYDAISYNAPYWMYVYTTAEVVSGRSTNRLADDGRTDRADAWFGRGQDQRSPPGRGLCHTLGCVWQLLPASLTASLAFAAAAAMHEHEGGQRCTRVLFGG